MIRHLLFLAIILLHSLVVSAEVVIFRAAYENAEQPPYYLGNSSNIPDKPGVAVEMVKGLQDKNSQLVVVLSRMPWSRCKAALEAGAVDGIFNASFKPERLSMGAYPMKDGYPDSTKRITKISYSLYKHVDSDLDWDGNAFLNRAGKIGAPLGYSIVGDLRKKGIAVEESINTLTNFRKLVRKRVVGVAAQDVTGDSLLLKHPHEFKQLHKVQPPLVTKDYYLMLSKQFVKAHPKVAEKIWQSIEEIRTHEFDEIAQKYAE